MVKPPEERRQEILDAALSLFHERGFAETTVQDVAAEAGVATGTVYLYFPSKDHMLLAIREDFERGLAARFADAATEYIDRADRGDEFDYREVLDATVEATIGYALEERRTCEVITRHAPGPDLMPGVLQAERVFVDLLARAIAEGVERGHLHTSDPQMTAYLINNAISHTVGDAITFDEPGDLERLSAQAKELLAKALAPRAAPDAGVAARKRRVR